MRVRRTTRWLGAIMAMAMIAVACAPDDPEEPAETTEDPADDPAEDDAEDASDPADTVDLAMNVFLYQEPVAWNPFLSFHGPDQQIMDLIFQKLLINNADFEFEGRLAESWEISEDARTFTFTLYEGLEWNDGTPLTAEDVKFTFDLLANPEVAGAAGRFSNVVGQEAYAEGEAEDVEGYQVIDDRTFAIELVDANVGFLTTIAAQSMFVLPEHVLGDIPVEELNDAGYFREPTVGYGPYNFVEFRVDEGLVLEANPNYHLGAPQIGTLNFRQLDGDVATAQLGTGELDLAFISATDVDLVEGFDNVSLQPAQGVGFIRMAINHTQERFQDERVRQALHYAIDRQSIVDVVLEGFGQVENVGFHAEWALPDDLNDYPYDPDRARELLEEAGWDFDQPVEIQWIPGTRDRDAAVPIIQEQWNAVGIQTEIVQVEVSELLEKAEEATYDFTLFGGGDYSADPHPFYLRLTCDALWAGPGWCEQDGVEELLELWRDADATADFDERQEKYHEIARTVNRLMPKVYLYNNDTIWAHNDRLQGFRGHGDFTEGFWNVHEWRIVE